MVKWIRRQSNLLIVLAVIFGLYGASWATDNHTRAVQQQQGRQVEQRLCRTLDALSALKPPSAGPGDLARKYEQSLQQTLSELGPDVGCR